MIGIGRRHKVSEGIWEELVTMSAFPGTCLVSQANLTYSQDCPIYSVVELQHIIMNLPI